MGISKLSSWVASVIVALTWTVGMAGTSSAEEASAKPVEKFENSTCLGCHGKAGFEMPGPDGHMRPLHVTKGKFGKSVHGKRLCVDCHTDITEIPHKEGVTHRVSCISCHKKLWEQAKDEGKTKENERLGVVITQIEHYMKSIHARPSDADQSRTNATCYDCHEAHYVYPKGSDERKEWRLNIPNTCGKCHAKQREEYATSVHGKEVLENKNAFAAICSDCHTTHDVASPSDDSTRLVIFKNCGNCHEDNLKTYLGTYHGQVSTLGYAYTAKCFDCHGSHTIQRVDDPKSMVHPDNRLNTCKQCHMGATKGFITFDPHGNTHDFARYPAMWVTSKFMIALLIGVFSFFWAHSALWFYREYQDRKQGKNVPHVMTAEMESLGKGKHYQRFGPFWRLAHLCFAISVMMLVLTGMSAFYAEAGWAQSIMSGFGGPRNAAIIHRIAAAVMLGIFFLHLVYVSFFLSKNWRNFDWFGPRSLVPNLKDLQDAIGMFKWFFGLGPRPELDRWAYWEKFDYWAVFWGMGIIGGSGLMLSLPNLTGAVLPGWVFNVATIIHGEEAFLAAVFLFTVHFFNNHLRPDKFPPPDVVMFTGAVSLTEFKHEHGIEYKRLVQSGEIHKYLVDAPSKPMTRASKILGIVLLSCGFILLGLVMTGFMGSLLAG
jgi:cytochrome b subunit of formate dehydrogenase